MTIQVSSKLWKQKHDQVTKVIIVDDKLLIETELGSIKYSNANSLRIRVIK